MIVHTKQGDLFGFTQIFTVPHWPKWCSERLVPWHVTVACLALPPADDLKLYLTAPTQHCLPSVSMGMVRNSLLVGCLRKPLLAKLFRFMFLQQSKKLIFPWKAENGPIIFKASSSYFLSQGWPLKLDHIEEDNLDFVFLFSLCTSYWLVYFVYW